MELERITPEQAGISGEKVKECIQKLMHDETQMHGFMAARDGRFLQKAGGHRMVRSGFTATIRLGKAIRQQRLEFYIRKES